MKLFRPHLQFRQDKSCVLIFIWQMTALGQRSQLFGALICVNISGFSNVITIRSAYMYTSFNDTCSRTESLTVSVAKSI